jgi:hypothetical protein
VNQSGSYVRIGKMVMAYCYLVVDTLGGASGQLVITGLPLSVASGTQRRSLFQPSFWAGITLPAGSTGWYGFGIQNDTTLRLYRSTLTGSSLGLETSHVTSTVTVYGTTVYEVA